MHMCLCVFLMCSYLLNHNMDSVNIMGFIPSAVSLKMGELASAHAVRPIEVSVHIQHTIMREV